MTEPPGLRVVQCNLAVPTKTAVEGARCYLVNLNPGNGSERILVLIRSRSGRWIEKWENIRRLHNFRAKTVPAGHPLYGHLRDRGGIDRGEYAEPDAGKLQAARDYWTKDEAAATRLVEPFAASGISFAWEPADPEPEAPAFAMAGFEVSFTVPVGHIAAVRLMDMIGGRESLRGAAVCACHPLPHPAARDYRRRTRHRNRRR